MEKLLEKLDDAAKLVAPMLEEKISEEIYINALRELILALNETTAEEIEKLEIDFAVKNSLGADKSLIKKSFPKEADQVSLISTLVTYEACRREGMPDHSRIYMDRVTAHRSLLRGKITAVLRKLKKLSAKKAKMSGEEHGII